MQGHGEKLSRKMELAIAALLAAPTMEAAAERVPVNVVTLWRWLQRPDFRDAYQAARREAVSLAIAKLQQASGQAVETLRLVMADSQAPASARVAAARVVLETALKAVELEDIQSRVAALEQLLCANRKAA